jgi:predicted GNAT family acetyltransferase
MSVEAEVPIHDPVRNNAEKQRFEVQIEDSIAIADYHLQGRTITFTHTEVPPSLKGRGVGSHLVKSALEESRKQEYRVVPACPFVAYYIRRHPEYADLVG